LLLSGGRGLRRGGSRAGDDLIIFPILLAFHGASVVRFLRVVGRVDVVVGEYVQVFRVDLQLLEVLLVRVLDVSLVKLVLVAHLLQGLALVQLLDRGLQVLQAQDENSDVVQGATCCGFSQADLNTFSCCDVLIVVEGLLSGAIKLFVYS